MPLSQSASQSFKQIAREPLNKSYTRIFFLVMTRNIYRLFHSSFTQIEWHIIGISGISYLCYLSHPLLLLPCMHVCRLLVFIWTLLIVITHILRTLHDDDMVLSHNNFQTSFLVRRFQALSQWYLPKRNTWITCKP